VSDFYHAKELVTNRCRVNRHVTHLVASTSRTRTHKVRQAAKYPHIKIVNQQWLMNSMSKWEKEPEEPYLVRSRTLLSDLIIHVLKIFRSKFMSLIGFETKASTRVHPHQSTTQMKAQTTLKARTRNSALSRQAKRKRLSTKKA